MTPTVAVLGTGMMGGPIARNLAQAGFAAPAFPLRLALKDANLVLEAAERHGIELPLARVTTERFKRAVEIGHGDEDMAAAYCATIDGKGG
jgi:3-hydroxyisobutyrate dehydrogenase